MPISSKVTQFFDFLVGQDKGIIPLVTKFGLSEPRPSRKLELVEANKSWLPVLHVVVYANWNLMYATKQDSRVSWLVQAGFPASSNRENPWKKNQICIYIRGKLEVVVTSVPSKACSQPHV